MTETVENPSTRKRHEDLASVNARFDGFSERLERVERRLELRENA